MDEIETTDAADAETVERLADAECRLAEASAVLRQIARRHRHVPGEASGVARGLLLRHGQPLEVDGE